MRVTPKIAKADILSNVRTFEIYFISPVFLHKHSFLLHTQPRVCAKMFYFTYFMTFLLHAKLKKILTSRGFQHTRLDVCKLHNDD